MRWVGGLHSEVNTGRGFSDVNLKSVFTRGHCNIIHSRLQSNNLFESQVNRNAHYQNNAQDLECAHAGILPQDVTVTIRKFYIGGTRKSK